jgi:hypothetical protein
MGSKSSTNTSTTNEFFDERQVNDASGGGSVNTNAYKVEAHSGSSVNITDHGAMNKAMVLAIEAQKNAAGFNAAALEKVFSMAGNSAAAAYQSSTEAIGAVAKAYEEKEAAAQKPLILALAAVGVLLFAWKGK